jgi:hypothetical protein
MAAWCGDSLGHGPAGCVNYSNIKGEGFCTLKEVAALVTIKQLARQA